MVEVANLLNLSEDLTLSHNEGVKARCYAEKMPSSITIPLEKEVRTELFKRHARHT
jgi:hypothetical protein